MTVRSVTQNVPTAHRLAVVLQQLAQIVVGETPYCATAFIDPGRFA